MTETVFTKIIKGELPSYRIYEDEATFAFLDIRPIQPGQILVVSKKPVTYVWELEAKDYQAFMATVKRMAKLLRKKFAHKTHVALQVEGLDVPHAHAKVFPFSTNEEFYEKPDPDTEPNHAELARIAKLLTKP